MTARLLILIATLAAAATLRAAEEEFTHRVLGLFAPERETALRDALTKIGVTLVRVDFPNAEATVRFDPAATFKGTKPEKFTERLNESLRNATRGTFSIAPRIPREKLTPIEIAVAGCDCTACNFAAYETLAKIEGVAAATVSFHTSKATALIDPEKTNRPALEAALKKRGVGLPKFGEGSRRPEDGAALRPTAPFIAWFEPPVLESRPELYAGATLITSLVEKHAPLLPRLSAQGTAGLRWAFGPTGAAAEHSRQSAEFYTKQFSPVLLKDGTMAAGVGIDEWNTGDPKFPQERDAAAAGYRAGRKLWPRAFAAAWVTQPDDVFISLLHDGTFDLAIVEGYTFIPDVGGLTFDGIVRRCEPLQRAGLLDRTIVCLGYISATPDKRGQAMTFAELERLARAIKQQIPQMPGIAFYGTKDASPATLELIAKAHALAAELFPRSKRANDDKR